MVLFRVLLGMWLLLFSSMSCLHLAGWLTIIAPSLSCWLAAMLAGLLAALPGRPCVPRGRPTFAKTLEMHLGVFGDGDVPCRLAGPLVGFRAT